MKKLLSLALSLMLILSASFALAEPLPQETLFNPGTYEAEAQGFGGMVQVSVTVSEDEILDVSITGEKETPMRNHSFNRSSAVGVRHPSSA